MAGSIDKLIINSPYYEPSHYWSYDRETRSFSLKKGRRPAGYIIESESSRAFDDLPERVNNNQLVSFEIVPAFNNKENEKSLEQLMLRLFNHIC